MSPRRSPQISSRKQPQQARSSGLVEAVLQAAVQVLEREGAAGFTMARVAERAGVSVGSLYQYFPNKTAILFRLQRDEWQRNQAALRALLEDPARPPLERLRALVLAFVRSEREEARVRAALHDAAPDYREAPEAREAHASGGQLVHDFMQAALPHVAPEARALAGELVATTLRTVGKGLSEGPDGPAALDARAGALADMLCAYLSSLGAT